MKKWYKSKTFWVNLIAIGSIITRSEFGLILTVEGEIALLAIINLLLRKITKEKIEW